MPHCIHALPSLFGARLASARLASARLASARLASARLASVCWTCAVSLALLVVAGTSELLADPPADEQANFFQQRVLPILQANCYQCHSHESRLMKGGLALDFRSGWAEGGDSGPAIIPKDPEASLLVQAIRRINGLEMPPDEPLAEEAVEVLVQWIKAGAFDDRTHAPKAIESDWWSLRTLHSPTITTPDIKKSEASQRPLNPIDGFIASELAAHDLNFSQAADRRTLIRRLYIDVLGLPPSMEEVLAFECDQRIDAYERLVDRVLASPSYGERWARHWMDTIHFADTHGFEHDVARPNAWPYRDYLIDQLNRDIPWGRFIREQLAADHFYPDEPQLTSALGFLGAGPFDISSFTTAPMTFAYLDRDDMLTQTMAAFASTTVNCARCHAHKFDPISQDDYFALQAVFAGVIKGDVAYDFDPGVAAQRQAMQDLLDSVQKQTKSVLLDEQWRETIANWERSAQSAASLWNVCPLESFESSQDCKLEKLPDGSLLASAPFPEREKVILRWRPTIERITALRVEVMPHDSLPAGGPGCAVNGNLHLTEVAVSLISRGNNNRQPLKLARASADFDQQGWTAAHAIDGKADTGWGIHPREGKSHAIVIEFAEAFAIDSDAQLEVVLHQDHGRSHIMGRFRLSASDQSNVRLAPLSDSVLAALRVPPDLRTADQKMTIATEALRAHAESELAKMPPAQRVYAAAHKVLAGNGTTAQSIDAPQRIEVLQRGDIGRPIRDATPGALAAIADLESRFEMGSDQSEATRRAALADWLADSKNPLTWRSIANRLWHYHFGRGLCDTPSDLGRMGGNVSHPELLDWLACEIRDGGESLKRLHRSILTSRTYRQASSHDARRAERDAENRWLWRQNRQRLDADCYRDAVLLTAGSLDRTRGGPGVEQFTTSPGPQLTPVVDYSKFDWSSQSAARRSIYRFVWRGIPDPLMEALDFPDLGLLTPVRAQSSSALQALTMYNSDFCLAQAQLLADRTAARFFNGSRSKEEQIRCSLQALFQATLQRMPTELELQSFQTLAEQHGLASVCRLLFNSNEFLFLD